MTRYTVGIDLGTTNCALSSRDLTDGSGDVLPIPQLTSPGTVEEQTPAPVLYIYRQGR